jgi:hypothetical protein
MPDLDRSSTRLVPSSLKGWLLSDSTGTQASAVIATGCLVAVIATLLREELSLDAALAFLGLIVAASVLDTMRACSRRDPVYGFSLAWKGALAVLFVMVALTLLTVIQVLQKTVPVSNLWQGLYKTGFVEVAASRVFRLTDPKG